MTRVACYIRVSTQEQAEHGFSIGEQKERMLAYCKAKDWIVYELYIDGGYSGSSLDRPAIQKLKEDINNFDLVLVYKLDRLSRSQFDILNLIENHFLPNNVDFVSMSEAFDTSTPFGRAMIGILGVFAQLEREQIRERSMMGRKARAKSGKFHGGQGPPLGYDYINGEIIVNEYEAEQVRMIFDMVIDHKSNDEIISALNEKGYKTKNGIWKDTSKIARLIRKTIYLGTITYGDVITENAHTPIIDQETFDRANAVKEDKRKKFGNNVYVRTTFLSGFIWCAKCGARFTTTISRKKKPGEPVTSQNRYHACYSRAFPNSKMAVQKGCTNKIWRMDALNDAVDVEVRKVLFDNKYLGTLLKVEEKPKKSKAFVEDKIAELDKQISKLMDLYSLESLSFEVLSKKIEELNKEKKVLQNKIIDFKKIENPISKTSTDEFRKIMRSASDLWEVADIQQKRFLLSTLVNDIQIDDENLIFNWTFNQQPFK